LNRIGTYPVIYTATNRGGLSASVTVNVHVVEAGTLALHELADSRLESLGVFDITDPVERARRIRNYVRDNMYYRGTNPSSPDDTVQFAFNVLQEMRGNCIANQRAAEILLQRAGIENVRINNNYATARLRHSWNLINIDGRWYHFDSTNFASGNPPDTHMFTMTRARELNRNRLDVYTFDASQFPTIVQ
jgi:transglutaminase-like putative cysteine protease